MAEAPGRYCGNCGNELSPDDRILRQRGVSHSDKEVSIVLSKFNSTSLVNTVQRKEMNDE
jgi:hypothetical protein